MPKKSLKKTISTYVIVLIAIASFLVISSFTIPSEVMAQKPQIDCTNATSTPEIRYCSQVAYKAADQKLNQVYKQVNSSIKGQQKQLLTSAQRSWILFRDNNCEFEVFATRGGTGFGAFRNGCLQRLTEQRTKDLSDFLTNK